MVGRRWRPGTRRGLVAAALAAGALAGAVTGAALLSGAAPPMAGPTPQVLHVAPAMVQAGQGVELTAATMCRQPDRDSCTVSGARALVRPDGAVGWTGVPATSREGAFHFEVSPQLVPDGGFSYWLEFRTANGGRLAYPPGGERSPIRVLTTSGLPRLTVDRVDWGNVRPADDVVLRLPFGHGDGEIGRLLPEGGEGQIVAHGSFDVGPEGSIYVDDWANGRIEVFDARGSFTRAFRAPVDRPADIAVGADGVLALSTLGEGAQAFELSPSGEVLGRYPIGYGIVARVGVAPSGPKVMVGPSQWAAVRTTVGRPLPAELQAQLQSATTPQPDGAIGVSQSLSGGRVAFAWARQDGSRAGAIVAFPRGVQAGSDYFVRPLPDGGAVAARGLWDATHYAVALLHFDAAGSIEAFSLLPEPSAHQAARFSTVRFAAPDRVLVAIDRPRGVVVEGFEVNR
jgi:hypothetical protein